MPQAWRLTFAYDGDDFKLKSARKLIKRLPPGEVAEKAHIGRYVELRGANRQVLYRRSITELLPATVEYRTGDPTRPLARVPAKRRGEIAVLVPAMAEGLKVALVAVGQGRPKTAHAAQAMQSGAAEEGILDLVNVDLPREGAEQ